MRIASNWTTYKILATGNGEKLENWNGVILLRPDPQIIWPSKADLFKTKNLNARYLRESTGGGRWQKIGKLPDEWQISYRDLTFSLKAMNFKHTGLFPEQAYNWDVMRDIVVKAKENYNRPIKILNLFAYTGGATVALAKEGAKVTHVDAAKGMVDRAKINCQLSNIASDSVRWIVDDCKKFMIREQKRGQTYDAIIMDPPSYGRAPDGSVFKLEDSLFELVQLASSILSDKPLFFLLNSYTTGLGASVMENILKLGLGDKLKEHNGNFESYELCLPTEENIVLPCGNSAMWRVE
ncbi:MAG: class I SAM-dependent methyltransferase [Firmicutes bacterium]|nr:class I SAM-dependent methyltransferase [Bacillota bacterium]